MRIAVCLKQVPDTEARLRVRDDGRWIDEEDLPFVINESDQYALEEALQLAESSGGEVIVFGLGPERIRESLRKGLALGAARAVHLKDDAFQGGDAISNGKALAAAISREEFDLVITGSQSDDAGYGGTGSVIAGHLGWPHAWLVMGVEIEEGGTAKVTREMEGGLNEVFRLRLPAVLQIQAGLNQPRYASLKGIMRAKRKEMIEVSLADLGFEEDQVGFAGARLEVLSVFFPDSSGGAQILEGDLETTARTLVDKLRTEARVLS